MHTIISSFMALVMVPNYMVVLIKEDIITSFQFRWGDIAINANVKIGGEFPGIDRRDHWNPAWLMIKIRAIGNSLNLGWHIAQIYQNPTQRCHESRISTCKYTAQVFACENAHVLLHLSEMADAYIIYSGDSPTAWLSMWSKILTATWPECNVSSP